MQLQYVLRLPLAVLAAVLFASILLVPVHAQSATSTTAYEYTSSTTSQAAATSSTASTTSNAPVTHTVSVGYAGFTYQPDVTLANVGDTIEFDFYPTNHSVVRSLYGYPCIPYEDTGVDRIGFFSGFEIADAILANPPTWQFKVNDSEPIFFYCSAPGSCINYGMVGVINPNATQSLQVQQQLAKEASFMLQPGEPWPSESTPDPFSTTAGSSPTATSEAGGSTTSSSTSHRSGLSSGAIAGIAVGGAAALILLGALFYLCGRNRALSDILHRNRHNHPSNDPRSSVMSGSTAYTSEPKHMSGFTYTGPNGEYFPPSHPGSPGLPQYVNLHREQRSPSLRGTDGSDLGVLSPHSIQQRDYMTRSPSPGMGQVPAYTAIPQEMPQDHRPQMQQQRSPIEMPVDNHEWGNDASKQGRDASRQP